MIVGVTGRLFFYPRRPKKDRDKIRSEIFAVGQSELSAVEQFIYTLEICFPGPTPAMLLVFLSVTNALVLSIISSVKAGSAIIEKV